MERLSFAAEAARKLAEQIDAEFWAKGQHVHDAELARWVQEREPRIPTETALQQVRAWRGN